MNVDAGATGLGLGDGGAMVVKLQGDADDVIAFRLHQRGHDRAVDAAGHGDDDTRILRAAGQIQTVSHFSSFQKSWPISHAGGMCPPGPPHGAGTGADLKACFKVGGTIQIRAPGANCPPCMAGTLCPTGNPCRPAGGA